MTGPFEIGVRIEAAGWPRALPRAETIAHAAAAAALQRLDARGEASIVLADDAFVQALNRDYRHVDRPTNVLAFAAAEAGIPDQPILLGDVVVALETTAREAAEVPGGLVHHLSHLVVHGVLHLLGHDHATDPEARVMERLETEILAGLGVADPHGEAPGVSAAAPVPAPAGLGPIQ